MDKAVVRRSAFTVPSFVLDCLETIEEIGMRAREDWKALGLVLGWVVRLVAFQLVVGFLEN